MPQKSYDRIMILHLLLCILISRTPRSTLFPYTTLFRLHESAQHAVRQLRHPACGHRPDARRVAGRRHDRSEEHTSELQSRENLVCRLLLEKKKKEKVTFLD